MFQHSCALIVRFLHHYYLIRTNATITSLTGPVIELEELDDLYPESDDDSVIVSTQMDSDTLHPDEEKVEIEWEEDKDLSSEPTEEKGDKNKNKSIVFEYIFQFYYEIKYLPN